MYRWLRNLFTRPPSEPDRGRQLSEEVRQLDLSLQKRLLESNLSVYDAFVDPREPFYDTADFFYPLVNENLPVTIDSRKRGEQLPVYLTPYGLKLIRDYSRRQCALNEFAINALTNRVSFTVGKGMTYRAGRKQGYEVELPPGKTDHLTHTVQQAIDAFIDRNDWGEMEQEAVWRCDRDGEVFIRFFEDRDGNIDARFVEPEHVVEPSTGETRDTFGIRTDDDDICKVEGYWIIERPDVAWEPTLVKADEVLHIKINGDRNAKRGVPSLFPVRKNLDRAEKLLRNISMLVQVQATYAVIRKHQGASPSAINTFANSRSSIVIQDPATGRNVNIAQMQPGSIVDSTPQIEYEFPSASVNTASLTEILQAELRAIASRFAMPEYMLGSNASNANYSSTMIAESPAVKNFERLQALFSDKFGHGCFRKDNTNVGVMWRVIQTAVRAGRLSEMALEAIDLSVEGPSLVVRERSQETNRLATLKREGVISLETWTQEEGYDFAREQRNKKREPKASPMGGAM